MRKAIEIVLDEGAEMTYVNNASLDEEDTTTPVATRSAAPMTHNAESIKGDAIVKDGSSFYVKKNETVSFFINPNENVAIKQVLYNDVDVTALIVNNTFTTPQVEDKSTLRVMLETTGDIHVSSIDMSKSALTLKESETVQIFATVLPHNATNKNVIWQSSDESIAIVDGNGFVKGLAAGTATITATSVDGAKVGTCQVTVLSNNYYFVMEDIQGFVGSSVSIPVSMINEHEVVAFQCDIHLPEGVEMKYYYGNYIEMTYRGNSHTTSAARMADGSYRVVVYSDMNVAFNGNEGVLFNIPVNITSAAGAYSVQLKNIHITGKDAVDFVLPDVSSLIIIDGYSLGD